jgi:acyl-CoA synthetase (AMP-forming)/AMP-acid ligase II
MTVTLASSPMAALAHAQSITNALAYHAAERPEQPFLILETGNGPHVTSFAGLFGKACQYGTYFAAQGVKPGDHVAALFTTHGEQAPVFFGAIMAGAVPFLMPTMTAKQDPALFWQAQLAALTRTDARLILTDADTKRLLTDHAPSTALAPQVLKKAWF